MNNCEQLFILFDRISLRKCDQNSGKIYISEKILCNAWNILYMSRCYGRQTLSQIHDVWILFEILLYNGKHLDKNMRSSGLAGEKPISYIIEKQDERLTYCATFVKFIRKILQDELAITCRGIKMRQSDTANIYKKKKRNMYKREKKKKNLENLHIVTSKYKQYCRRGKRISNKFLYL